MTQPWEDPSGDETPGTQPWESEAPMDADTFANNLRQLLGQGTALGFGDEIEGAVRGAYESLTTDTPIEDAVSKNIDAVRAQNLAFEQQHPGRSLALQLGGGVLTGLGGAARAGVASGAKTLGQKMLAGSKVGGGTGAVAGAGFGTGGLSERGIAAGIGGATGAALGGLTPAAVAGTGRFLKTLGRIVPGGAKRQAAGIMKTAAAEDELTAKAMAGKLAGMPEEAVEADVGGESLKDIARAAGNVFGGKQAAKMLRERQEAQGWRISEQVDKTLSKQTLDDFLESTTRKRRIQADADYSNVYAKEMTLTDELKRLMENKQFQSVYKEAQKLAQYEGKKLPKLITKRKGAVVYAKPSVRVLDYVKQALDDKISALYRTGKGTEAGLATKMRDDLRDHMDDQIPEYKQTRSAYAGHSAALDAAELGKKYIAGKSVSMGKFDKLGAHEKESFRVGVADELRNRILGTADIGGGGDVTKKIFGNKLVRERLKKIFETPEQYAKFRQGMENEIAMFDTQARVRIGARTTPMAQDIATMAKPAGLVGDVLQAARGSPTGVTGLIGRGMEKLGAPPEAVAKHLTGMLLSQDPAAKARALQVLGGGHTAPRYARQLLPAAAPVPMGLLSGGGGGPWGANPLLELNPFKR